MPRVVHEFIYYYIYEKWCNDHYPDVDTTRCIATFLHYKINANNRMGHWQQAESHHYITKSQRDSWNMLYSFIIYAGLFCYLFEIQLI